ncbi:diguanylate cyclase [Rhodovarius crocodyli]|uniref:diguanylate cyclase n=1 Tax=Rhodovarius crocodyli TaxID=1979269 RepID=A0A437LXG1_9PROT|nr:diguanylate cyclase [Rhodovarius crocodyli]RVT90069.1 diguanylate cyclase [Rhodovarius crocodyli]
MKILLVEPGRLVQRLVRAMLETAGHAVVVEGHGLHALETLRADPSIDLLLTSFELPGMPGMELCWHARLLNRPCRPPLYLIAMSSSLDDAHVAEALDAGADDFVFKPPSVIELTARLRAAERLLHAQRALIEQATTDALTGLPNRRRLLEEARRAPGAALALLDIDHFKAVNDTHGHDSGDAMLVALAERLKEAACFAARLGGEEFALLIPDPEAAEALMEGLRQAVGATRVPLHPGLALSVTVSIGLALPRAGAGIDQMLREADLALYAAKRAGRDRVVLAEPAPPLSEEEPRRRVRHDSHRATVIA